MMYANEVHRVYLEFSKSVSKKQVVLGLIAKENPVIRGMWKDWTVALECIPYETRAIV